MEDVRDQHDREDAGKKVGVWCCGNENELLAALVKNGIDPKNKSDVTIVNQPFDMNLFLQSKVDAAAAMTYNELAQVLESKNPKTGKLYKLSDLNVITMEKAGTAMLEDGHLRPAATGSRTRRTSDIAKRFLAASFKGWAYCRDHVEGVHEHRAQERPDARRGSPALADERDQQADLAGVARRRGHEPEGVRADGCDRQAVQGDLEACDEGRVPHRPRQGALALLRSRG